VLHLVSFVGTLINLKQQCLDAFEKLQKSNCSLHRVCVSARMELFVSHWTDFHEILYLRIFQKSIKKIQVSLKSDKNNGTLHENIH